MLQQLIGIAVAVHHEAEIGRLVLGQIRISRFSIRFAIPERVVHEHDEAREVDGVELAERNEMIAWVGKSGPARKVHLRQSPSQAGDIA